MNNGSPLATPVIMEDCKVVNVEISSPSADDGRRDGNFSVSVKVQFTKTALGDGATNALSLSVSFDSTGAPYYRGSIDVRSKFVFPEGSSEELVDDYLKYVGSSRTYDFAKAFIESATVLGVYGPLELPPFDSSKVTPMKNDEKSPDAER